MLGLRIEGLANMLQGFGLRVGGFGVEDQEGPPVEGERTNSSVSLLPAFRKVLQYGAADCRNEVNATVKASTHTRTVEYDPFIRSQLASRNRI